ncbi:MAG TPA: hypothetical protein VF988_10255 [Verrucomicrobiae bacterium]
MKFAGTLLIALVFAAGLRAQEAAALEAGGNADATGALAADKPYATIVARNIFGLIPIPPPDPNAGQPPPDPPPKITPTGIMTIFGKLQALFRVASKPKPGQPAKEEGHVLGEGEMVEEIEVVKIDQANRSITFNNHGQVQELALMAAKDAGSAPSPASAANPRLGLGGAPITPADRAAIWRNRQAALKSGIPAPVAPSPSASNPSYNNNSSSYNSGYGNSGVQLAGGQQQPNINNNNIEDQVMSAARDMAQIEMNRIATQEAVNKGLMPPLPPTLLTPADATAAGGSPLIVNPNTPQNPQRQP